MKLHDFDLLVTKKKKITM